MERLQIREGGQNYSEGAMKLIFELVKGTFVAGLRDERIRYVVKTKGEEESLAQIVETALQEECEVRSFRYKPNVGNSQWTSNRDRNTRPSNFPTQHIKREVNVAISSPTERNQCYRCLGTGHIARECRNTPQRNKCKKRGHDTHSCKTGLQGNRQ
jgi:Zinc knuckle.